MFWKVFRWAGCVLGPTKGLEGLKVGDDITDDGLLPRHSPTPGPLPSGRERISCRTASTLQPLEHLKSLGSQGQSSERQCPLLHTPLMVPPGPNRQGILKGLADGEADANGEGLLGGDAEAAGDADADGDVNTDGEALSDGDSEGLSDGDSDGPADHKRVPLQRGLRAGCHSLCSSQSATLRHKWE